MADRGKALEIQEGLIINPDFSTEGSFISSGPSSPVGDSAFSSMVAGDLFIQKSTKPILWQKTGAGVNDWRQLEAQDIPFDPTNADQITDTNVQATLESLANRNFGKDSAFDQADGPFTTTSGTFVTVFTLNLNVLAVPDGTYRLGWNVQDVTSKSNTLGQIQIVVDAGLPSEIVVALDIVSFVEGRFSGFDSGVIANGARTVDIQIRRSAGNGFVSVSDVSLEAWRVL